VTLQSSKILKVHYISLNDRDYYSRSKDVFAGTKLRLQSLNRAFSAWKYNP
jgi:hypothetical protein